MQTIEMISNGRAGRGRAESQSLVLLGLLEAAGLSVRFHQPDSAGETREIACQAVADGVDCVVIAGGDGSVSGVLDTIAGSDTALAVLPVGRGNDFVRGMGLPESVQDLANGIAQGRTRAADLGSVNGKCFGTVTSLGLDAEAGRLAAKGTLVGGMGGYLIEGLKCLRSFDGYPVRVTVDGDVVTDSEITLVACANTATYGGGFRIAPGASPSDGLLDVCLVSRVTRLSALPLLARMAVGKHPGHAGVTMLSATEVEIETSSPLVGLADGETVEGLPLVVKAKPDAIRLVY